LEGWGRGRLHGVPIDKPNRGGGEQREHEVRHTLLPTGPPSMRSGIGWGDGHGDPRPSCGKVAGMEAGTGRSGRVVGTAAV
jgi:hypothetical protein